MLLYLQKNSKQSDRLQVGSMSPTTDSLSESTVHNLRVREISHLGAEKGIKCVQLKMVQGYSSRNCWVLETETCYVPQCNAGGTGVGEWVEGEGP